ncbi:phosphatase PAP2-related protein [Hymenobacter daecheongensis]|uniref:phosphatase PAP2-related protein n=1 Tax=Hymenobacter daecheongensis TaxID=496053 RepID=UPI00116151C0|nr:phosphatase PAP2-related protein [Hymenobacter daecheongensis]
MPTDSLLWPAAWAWPAFRRALLLGLALLLVLAAFVPHYFAYIQARPGFVLPDPLLAALPAHDVSGPTFGLIYLSIGATLGYLLRRPALLLHSLWAYLLLHAFRTLTLYLVPLEPPAGLLLLHDPFVDRFLYGGPTPITKDLFFSGHTATLFLLSLSVRPRLWRQVLLAATVAVGMLVLVQHTHYTYDVLAAPFFAAASYWLAGRLVRGVVQAQ